MRIAQPEAAADRAAQRHHRGAADLLQAQREHRVVGRVRQHREALFGQLFGRRQQLDGVGQQRAVVADDLELDPVRAEGLASQLRRQHGLRCRVTTGRVGQHPHIELVEQGEQRAVSRRLDAAHRHRGHRGARLDQRRAQRLEAGHAAGSEEKARGQDVAGDDQPVGARRGLGRRGLGRRRTGGGPGLASGPELGPGPESEREAEAEAEAEAATKRRYPPARAV